MLQKLWDFTLSVLWYLAKLILLETLTQYLIEVTGQGWDIRLNSFGFVWEIQIKSFMYKINIKIGRDPGSRSITPSMPAVDSSVSSQWLRFLLRLFFKMSKNEKIMAFLWLIMAFLCGDKNVVLALTWNSSPIADGLILIQLRFEKVFRLI